MDCISTLQQKPELTAAFEADTGSSAKTYQSPYMVTLSGFSSPGSYFMFSRPQAGQKINNRGDFFLLSLKCNKLPDNMRPI